MLPPSAYAEIRPSCLGLLAGAALLLGGCSNGEEPAPAPPRIAIVEKLQAADAEPQALHFAGVVESVTSTQLSFQVPGQIERILVDEGTQVTRGQPLATLDDTDYQLQLRDAKAQERQLAADLARKRNLLAEGILSRAAIEPLEAGLTSAEVARDTARRNITHSTLKAPFDGVVAQRMAEPDMVVDSGTPILLVQDNRHIEVGVDLSERAALSVPLGPDLHAEGHLVIGELSLPLRYKEHSTQPREGSRTYRLILQGEPPENFNLLPGMAMRVSLQLPASQEQRQQERFLIPLSALQTAENDQHYIWLAVEGEARRQDLVLESIEDGRALISGAQLRAGSEVIVAGGNKVSEGLPIQTQRRD
ncbi:efflux RND transporter periplasmic adaptor subunit [Halopseudomonas pelagia]|uniref:Efflux RND transporter periplasmic adaptor subunit n=1 Tax=Halopseudomonas pelagia TaxID=553151 RepID=A0AA91U512_9GAMM|nr:efflux RND transporter periplasmic adaptor subunit [Halopseudomonas pelagia]PCD00552.1 efflux transporter periplasmic adaptor subunit [Halopseudomonas pelagia]QFY55255.1 efflux RND transporter periplasmic adaptor subunit [Halopseudomonas pelagia]